MSSDDSNVTQLPIRSEIPRAIPLSESISQSIRKSWEERASDKRKFLKMLEESGIKLPDCEESVSCDFGDRTPA